jgi:hypothetical protein
LTRLKDLQDLNIRYQHNPFDPEIVFNNTRLKDLQDLNIRYQHNPFDLEIVFNNT